MPSPQVEVTLFDVNGADDGECVCMGLKGWVRHVKA